MKIQRGMTRTVLLTRKWAIKVPAFRRTGKSRLWCVTAGIQANMSEREWSTAQNICPVLWSLWGIVNVHRRAGTVLYLDHDAYPPLIFDGVAVRTDPKLSNVGVLDGRLVWVDYDQRQGACQTCQRAVDGPLAPPRKKEMNN